MRGETGSPRPEADARSLANPIEWLLVPAAVEDVLSSEQTYLANARADLDRMRRRTLSLEVQGGNAVSAEYLSAALYHRAKALMDDPSTTLFFGRTDHTDGHRWYIGRRHVSDPAGDPVVIDWRAEVARSFYRASRNDRMGVDRRRRFGVEQGKITAYEDEHLADPSEQAGKSQILAHEIERPRMGPMRDIVATIQPEQDVIVRAGVETSVCIQALRGPARPRSGCTARPGCCTRTGRSWLGPGCSWSGRTSPSWSTSTPCCPAWVRPRSGTPRWSPW